MSGTTGVALPLFAESHAQAEPVSDDAAEIAQLEAVARAHPVSGFAYYQDEPEMKWYFEVRNATRIVYRKADSLPDHIEAYLTTIGDRGTRAMSAAQYREDTDAELNDRINDWQAQLRAPIRKRSRRPEDEDDFGADDEDMNRKILGEWLEIALEERARRARIPGFDHLADVEQRAREKFGEEGLALINLYVAQAMAMESAPDGNDVLINGKDLPVVYEAMQSLAQGDPGAAERFVNVLATARNTQEAGYPEGAAVTFAPSSSELKWTDERAKAAAAARGIVINDVPIDLDEYRWSFTELDAERAVTPEQTPQWWTQFFEQALQEAHGSPRAEQLEAMVGARIREPILAVWHAGRWHIIDGNRRLASRFYCRLQKVPAICGVPRTAAQESAAQQNLFGGNDTADEYDDDFLEDDID